MKNIFLILVLFASVANAQSIRATATAKSVTLSWIPATVPLSNPPAPVLSINVYRGTSAGAETLLASSPITLSALPTCPDDFPSTNLCYTDTSVVSGNAYYYEVTSLNANGEAPRSNELLVTVGPPVAPTNASAIWVHPYPSVMLQWSPSATPGTIFYNVYRDVSGTSKYVKINVAPLVCSGETENMCGYYDNTVAHQMFYNYLITSWSSTNGESGYSNKIFAPKTP